MTYEPDYKKLCVEASRLYYYGRHDGLASVMRQIVGLVIPANLRTTLPNAYMNKASVCHAVTD